MKKIICNLFNNGFIRVNYISVDSPILAEFKYISCFPPKWKVVFKIVFFYTYLRYFSYLYFNQNCVESGSTYILFSRCHAIILMKGFIKLSVLFLFTYLQYVPKEFNCILPRHCITHALVHFFPSRVLLVIMLWLFKHAISLGTVELVTLLIFLK